MASIVIAVVAIVFTALGVATLWTGLRCRRANATSPITARIRRHTTRWPVLRTLSAGIVGLSVAAWLRWALDVVTDTPAWALVTWPDTALGRLLGVLVLVALILGFCCVVVGGVLVVVQRRIEAVPASLGQALASTGVSRAAHTAPSSMDTSSIYYPTLLP